MEKIIKVYDSESYMQLIPGIKVIQIHKIETATENIVPQIPKLDDLNISSTLSCSYCKINFEDNIQQRHHYKSDWHRYNLKQNLKSLDSISEDNFVQLADDVSSISGSDTESDDNSERDSSINALYQGKIYFQNSNGNVFSIYRTLLHEKKDAPASDEGLYKIVRQCSKNTFWTVLMFGGGHFAGAVYDGANVLVHKTFHSYTVRAKQGGSQGTRDNKSGGAHPKSAGASLRRYNELSLIQHVGDILIAWESFIEKSNLIFYRAAGPHNRSVLFGGKNPVLRKHDSRLRTIPFSTKRPTYTELTRVHDVLTNVELYNSLESIQSQLAIQKTKEETDSPRQNRRESPKNKNINRAKSRETKERPLPGAEDNEENSSSDSENEEEFTLETEDLELSFADLKQFDDTVPEGVKKKKVVKKKRPKKKDRIKKKEDNLKRDLYNACSKGDLELLKTTLHGNKEDTSENDESNLIDASKTINMVIDEHGNTLLHIAALNSNIDIILWLMENDATPCNKNDKQHTPYTINANKTIRNVFRNFASENPDKFNYAKSQIPVIISTLTEEELAEKRKAQRKMKKEREKEKRKENEMKRKEDDDRNRYLKLSDREKRALAAERRILAQTSSVLVRCFLCGEDISGKVPFEYSGNRFCSITCLKAHRFQTPVVLS